MAAGQEGTEEEGSLYRSNLTRRQSIVSDVLDLTVCVESALGALPRRAAKVIAATDALATHAATFDSPLNHEMACGVHEDDRCEQREEPRRRHDYTNLTPYLELRRFDAAPGTLEQFMRR
jgi:hypothetical protein